jgi:hypothetical protein
MAFVMVALPSVVIGRREPAAAIVRYLLHQGHGTT